MIAKSQPNIQEAQRPEDIAPYALPAQDVLGDFLNGPPSEISSSFRQAGWPS